MVEYFMECGIVGLPNVGKSTFFNGLTASIAAAAANYPFCTIEPNVGTVCVPDSRLNNLANIYNSKEVLPAQLSFVDIAGLVKGASEGAGLGNQFLSHIRNVDAIIHMVRCFVDPDIIHVAGEPDPLSDIAVIENELLLADLQSVEQRLGKKKKDEHAPILEKIHAALLQGHWANTVIDPFDPAAGALQLLTLKPVMYVANTRDTTGACGAEIQNKENQWLEQVRAHGKALNRPVITLCAQLEAEMSSLDSQTQATWRKELDLQEAGLNYVIRAAYALLNRITFFTAGPKEVRAWTVARGAKAPEAAGVIHTDFQRGFIRAETVTYEDLMSSGSLAKAKENGVLRSEGKDYVTQDGDVMLFRFNV